MSRADLSGAAAGGGAYTPEAPLPVAPDRSQIINSSDEQHKPTEAQFNIYAVSSTDPKSASLKANVLFVAPAGSVLRVSLDRGYHSIKHTDDTKTTDYGHLFNIIDIYGNIIATGVINGLNFTTVSIGIAPTIPVAEQPADVQSES